MPTTVDLLHDRVDAREDLRERARDAITKVMHDRLGEALDQSGGDPVVVFELLAVWSAGVLADLTTEAVQSGASSVHG